MGIGVSKQDDHIITLEEENKKLKNIIIEKDKLACKQMNMIELLQTKESATHYLKNGIYHNFNDNTNNLISDSKTNKDYDFIVFSGGGVKGISYSGAIKALDELGILYDNTKKFRTSTDL